METNQEMEVAPQLPAHPSTTTPASTMLDLNPTAFVDDLHNSVDLHCATAFDELDAALRSALQEQLTPEQLIVLIQGTAGLYQDLKMEIKKQMQSFEEYALAEILKVPAGLMAEGPEGPSDTDTPDISAEEEQAAVDEIKELRQKIAAGKRRTREMQSASAELQRLMVSAQAKLAKLEMVPSAVAGKENLTEDVKALAEKGAAVEAGCLALDHRYRHDGLPAPGTATAPDGGQDAAATAAALFEDDVGHIDGETLTDTQVQKEILKRQAVVKAAHADDLKAITDSLLGNT